MNMSSQESELNIANSQPKQFPFPATMRLRKTPEFAAVFDRKCRASDQHLLLFGIATEAESRYGLSVSKKHGNAIKRNRIKRLLREAIRHVNPSLPGHLDIVVIPRVNSGATVNDYSKSLRYLVGKLARKLGSPK
jgi:ribonuclease P protein component